MFLKHLDRMAIEMGEHLLILLTYSMEQKHECDVTD